jgi:hypothetical protein
MTNPFVKAPATALLTAIIGLKLVKTFAQLAHQQTCINGFHQALDWDAPYNLIRISAVTTWLTQVLDHFNALQIVSDTTFSLVQSVFRAAHHLLQTSVQTGPAVLVNVQHSTT